MPVIFPCNLSRDCNVASHTIDGIWAAAITVPAQR
jgi:hypothetical protein